MQNPTSTHKADRGDNTCVSFLNRLAILALLLFSQAFVYGQSIKGKVTSSKDESLSGVNVHLLNTNSGTATDEQGNFELKDVSSGSYQIQFSAVGFATVEQKIEVTSEGVSLNLQLAETATQLEDVVVTAQKTEEEIQKISLSVSAVSSSQIQQYRMWNTKDITAIVPNLYSANPGDGRNVTSIRGITSTSYDPSVATYIDGVNQFSLDTYIAPLTDVE